MSALGTEEADLIRLARIALNSEEFEEWRSAAWFPDGATDNEYLSAAYRQNPEAEQP